MGRKGSCISGSPSDSSGGRGKGRGVLRVRDRLGCEC